MEKQTAVYILASKRNGTLYIGSTRYLIKRIWEHKNHFVEGFTNKYDVDKLVYYELHDSYDFALQRERQIKKWKREWKINLIESNNPDWKDCYAEIM